MLVLKGCTRCHGDLVVTNESFGEERRCLQCGALQYSREPLPRRLRENAKEALVRVKPAA